MEVFANGKRRFHSFIEFFVIHLKYQEVKIFDQPSQSTSFSFVLNVLLCYGLHNVLC